MPRNNWIIVLSVNFILLLLYSFIYWKVGVKWSGSQSGSLITAIEMEVEDSFGTWTEFRGVMRGQFFLLNDSTLLMVLKEVVAKGQPYKIEGIRCVECPRQDLGVILAGDVSNLIYPGDSTYEHYAAKFLLQR